MRMPLDLLVPGLLPPPAAPEALRLPALERWLARADLGTAAMRGEDAFLAHAFELAAAPPVAAITLAADRGPRDGTWLRADPVHLVAGQDGVAMQPTEALEVDAAEAAACVAALQAHFAADGFEFDAPHPKRWYVRVPEGEAPRTTPLADAVGRDVFGLLPRGGGRVNWPAAITEAQMILSAHAVNEAREQSGRAAINSVWFWGEGALPPQVRSPFALVYSDDAFATGLARLSGTPHAAVPARLDGIDAVRPEQTVVVVLDALRGPARLGDAHAWERAARALDETWFAELPDAIERFERVRLWLPRATDTRVATLTAASRRRWYRRRRPLASYA